MAREPNAQVRRRLVRTARPAAVLALGRRTFLDLEGMAAAARRGDVRVGDLEPRFLDRLQEVDLGAAQVRRAERIDHERDALRLDRVVTLLGAPVEPQCILEPRASPALDGDTEYLGLSGRFLRHQL